MQSFKLFCVFNRSTVFITVVGLEMTANDVFVKFYFQNAARNKRCLNIEMHFDQVPKIQRL